MTSILVRICTKRAQALPSKHGHHLMAAALPTTNYREIREAQLPSGHDHTMHPVSLLRDTRTGFFTPRPLGLTLSRADYSPRCIGPAGPSRYL